LKAVSGKGLCKALERKGWQLIRVRGSHHIYRQPGNPTDISVPVHANKSLKTGTQLGIMKSAGLTEDDL
jgi:predicted RNA binding protein YcfA (HicA-like mRNA interferase family)